VRDLRAVFRRTERTRIVEGSANHSDWKAGKNRVRVLMRPISEIYDDRPNSAYLLLLLLFTCRRSASGLDRTRTRDLDISRYDTMASGAETDLRARRILSTGGAVRGNT